MGFNPGRSLGSWIYDVTHSSSEAEAASLIRKPKEFARDLNYYAKAANLAATRAGNPEVRNYLLKASEALSSTAEHLDDGVGLVKQAKRLQLIIKTWKSIEPSLIRNNYDPDRVAGQFSNLFVNVGYLVGDLNFPMAQVLGDILVECGGLITNAAKGLGVDKNSVRPKDPFLREEVEYYAN